MTRKQLLRHSITFAIGWIIANLLGAYIWPVEGVSVLSRLVTSLIVIAAVTALLYRWTSPQERPPDADDPRDQ